MNFRSWQLVNERRREAVDAPAEGRAVRAAGLKAEPEVNDARGHGFLFGILTVECVWVIFNGLWSFVEELLREFLPPFFAVWCTIAIIVGIGGLTFHRGVTGESWFNERWPSMKVAASLNTGAMSLKGVASANKIPRCPTPG